MSIISISGKKGSGKDLVGKIIQYWIYMDTPAKGRFIPYPCEQFIHEYKEDNNINFDKETNWIIKKFAGKLKEVCSILTGISIEHFEDHNFKETYLDSNWDKKEPTWKGTKPFEVMGKLETIKLSVRDLLQKVGTEAIRNQIHENAWVNALFVDYKIINEDLKASMGNIIDYSKCFPNWIITDTRFPNEIETIKKRGGITIKVIRYTDKPLDLHPSETALDNYKFDYVLDNNSDIDSLMVKVRTLLQELKLIK